MCSLTTLDFSTIQFLERTKHTTYHLSFVFHIPGLCTVYSRTIENKRSKFDDRKLIWNKKLKVVFKQNRPILSDGPDKLTAADCTKQWLLLIQIGNLYTIPISNISFAFHSTCHLYLSFTCILSLCNLYNTPNM
jgi:hypothetical protein